MFLMKHVKILVLIKEYKKKYFKKKEYQINQ